ncbi:MAG: phage holin family protein [Schwartzia sp.]|nr:phage holin family protein [Schwartzia sp. (in: firmicutes)]
MNTNFDALAQSAQNFFSNFWVKATASAVLTVTGRQHAVLFLCFVLLVFLDCLTRWIAISYRHLVEQGEEHPSLIRAIFKIPAARRAGKIESRVMKEQGLCKLFLYGVCVIVACVVDLMMATLHAPGWMVNLMVSYMAITETLSVVENLSDAGVDSLARLVEKLKGRL